MTSCRANQICSESEYDDPLKGFVSTSRVDLQNFELVELFRVISAFCRALPRKVSN